MTLDASAFSAFERAAHDRLAETYAALFTPITGLALGRLLDAAGVGPGARVLNVATGPGLAAAAARDRGAAAVVGVDLSPRMLEVARAAHSGIEFREADVVALPFPDSTFDAVISNFGLGHFPRPEAAVAECVRVLAPGGSLALSWWDDPERQRVQGLFREAIAEVGALPPPELPQGHPVFRFSDTGEFLALLRGAGLDDVSVAEHRTAYTLPDADALWGVGMGSLAVTGATVAGQDEATRARIRAALARRAEAYRTPDGLAVPISFKIGSGRRAA
jgi:SAM-dependent methyltransferase